MIRCLVFCQERNFAAHRSASEAASRLVDLPASLLQFLNCLMLLTNISIGVFSVCTGTSNSSRQGARAAERRRLKLVVANEWYQHYKQHVFSTRPTYFSFRDKTMVRDAYDAIDR
jgi:hypothetical protein